jgi:hypothetical protein
VTIEDISELAVIAIIAGTWAVSMVGVALFLIEWGIHVEMTIEPPGPPYGLATYSEFVECFNQQAWLPVSQKFRGSWFCGKSAHSQIHASTFRFHHINMISGPVDFLRVRVFLWRMARRRLRAADPSLTYRFTYRIVRR